MSRVLGDVYKIQLSAYHNEILPGIYDLSTNMTAEQMLEVMSTPVKETEDAASE